MLIIHPLYGVAPYESLEEINNHDCGLCLIPGLNNSILTDQLIESTYMCLGHEPGRATSSSLGSRCVPGLGEGLSMSSPNEPVLCCPLPYRVAPVFVQVVSPRFGWSPLSSFLVIWSPSGDARGPSVVFEAVNMLCPGPLQFSHSVDYFFEFCPLPDPDVGPSIFVCDVEHTSFHFGMCGRKFVLCLFVQCPGLCTICHSWQHTGVVHLSLQADGKVAFEDIPVFGVCRPACHDSSLYLFGLVLFLEAVVLSQVQSNMPFCKMSR